jgi:hypothetical protein
MKHAGTTVPGCPGGDGCVADDGDGRTDQAAAVGEPLLRFDGSRRNAVWIGKFWRSKADGYTEVFRDFILGASYKTTLLSSVKMCKPHSGFSISKEKYEEI